MKHLKIYEAFRTNGVNETITLSEDLVNILFCQLTNLDPDCILYDWNDDYYEDDGDESEEHERMLDEFSYDKYYTKVSTFITNWIHENGLVAIKQKLPLIQNITDIAIKMDKQTGTRYLQFDITINPKELVECVINLMEDDKFTQFIYELNKSYSGFVSFMPSTEADIIEVLEQTTYDKYYKILQCVYAFHKDEISENIDESIFDYVYEKMCGMTIADFQI